MGCSDVDGIAVDDLGDFGAGCVFHRLLVLGVGILGGTSTTSLMISLCMASMNLVGSVDW